MIIAQIPITQEDMRAMRSMDSPEDGILIPMMVKGKYQNFIVKLGEPGLK